MNDLETRAEQAFRDALSRQADTFEPTPLAPLRRESHARRIGLIAVAASVLLVLGTTVGVVLWRGNSADRGPAEDLAAPAAGWRYESYRDVQIEVPESWSYDSAPRADWCAGAPRRASQTPFVDVGQGGYRSILCTEKVPNDLTGEGVPERLWATHVRLGEVAGRLPDGTATAGEWTRIVRTVGSAQVWLLADADHLEDARKVVESARIVDTDHNGCETTSEMQTRRFVRPPAPFDVTTVADVDSIAVCQYAVGSGTVTPGLVASRRLTGDVADTVLAALKSAPVGGGPDIPSGCLREFGGSTGLVLLLRSGAVTREMYVYNTFCTNNGFDDGTHVRELTRDACVPLYGERVAMLGGDGRGFERCHRDFSGATKR